MSRPFWDSSGKVGFCSRHCRGKGPHLALRGESPGFSRVVATYLGFLSSYDEDLRDPLLLPQKSQFSMWLVKGLSGFLSRRCSGLSPHMYLSPETQGSSPVLTWIAGFLWSFNRGVMPRFLWRHGNPLASWAVKIVSGFLRVDIGICGFHSRCHRAVTTPIVFWGDTCGDSIFSAGQSGVSGMDCDIRVFLNCGTTPGNPLEVQVKTREKGLYLFSLTTELPICNTVKWNEWKTC